MAGLLKFLFFLIIGWYLFKYLMRLLAPFFLKKFTEKMMRKAQENPGGFSGRGFYYQSGNPFNNNSQQRYSAEDGEDVQIDYIPPKNEKSKKRAISKEAGEFIDFEEIN
ncbi:MAG TPA: DUF4834 family protein [Candidatus Sphingobacterium stercoripullorum]|uniref:DUF4834 family protein n=1 Tax=Candidatus Sphingobacterium stercoripullorum TaxID=2838759 RepID=A0A9D1W991_9SPHI|nr:DUF4834 family protein [Candidatus Sphingobacterium stercoripullorum]